MGAQADVQLTLTFLEKIHELWSKHPGSYSVKPDPNDLVPALAQTCIKALAVQLRHTTDSAFQRRTIEGEVTTGTDGRNPGNNLSNEIKIRSIVNMIVHANATAVQVRDDGTIRLHFEKANDPISEGPDWAKLWFSATEFVSVLTEKLSYGYERNVITQREGEIYGFVESLGVERFMPSPSSTLGHE